MNAYRRESGSYLLLLVNVRLLLFYSPLGSPKSIGHFGSLGRGNLDGWGKGKRKGKGYFSPNI
jgi:hypothetical protein